MLLLMLLPSLVLSQTNKSLNKSKNLETKAGKFSVIKFSKILHDFGVVEEGMKISCDFQFTNVGKKTVFIKNGCRDCDNLTVVSIPNKVAPGNWGEIDVVCDTTGASGKYEKKILLEADDPKVNIQPLKISFTIARDVEVSPNPVYFSGVKKSSDSSVLLYLKGSGSAVLKVLSAESKNGSVSIVEKQDLEKGEYQKVVILALILSKNLHIGKFNDEIIIKTNSEKRPEITIPLSGEIVGRIQVFPKQIHLDNQNHRSMTLRVRTDLKGFGIEKITSSHSTFKVEKKEMRLPNNQIGVYIQVSLKDSFGDLTEDEMTVWTNDKDQPKIVVPVKITKSL